MAKERYVMRKFMVACLIALPVTTSGCASLTNLIGQGLAVTQLQFGFDKAELKRADIPVITPNASADMLITLNATNPNPVKAAIDRFGFDLLMDGTKVGVGSLNNGLSVDPKASTPFTILVTIPYAGLPAAVFSAFQNRRSELTLSGTSNISTPLGNIGFPIALSKTVTF
jgi:LEA14-like dessication related protein